MQMVEQLGSQKESWRYKGYDPSRNPRGKTLQRGDVFSDVGTVKPEPPEQVDPFVFNDEFVEIEHSFMDPSHWHLQFCAHMSIPEHITLLEGRGIVAALRHKLRGLHSFNKRHLHLNDNLAAVLIAEKGRSASIEMLRVARRLTALLVAANCCLCTRWIPSEWNVKVHVGGKLLAEPKSEAAKRRKMPNSSCSIPGRENLKGLEQPKLFSEDTSPFLKKEMTQKNLRRALQGKSRSERQAKRAKVTQIIPQSPRFPGQTFLEQMAVTAAVSADYRQRYRDFLQHCQVLKMDISTMERLDEALTDYLNYMFFEGMDISEGSKSFAACLDANPVFSSKTMMLRSRRALQGWTKLDPGNTRPPVPWEVVAMLSHGMVSRGLLAESVALVLMFVAYLRPGEVMKLLEEDLVAPRSALRHHAINLHASERQEQSKVGLTDETILLDSSIMPRLGTILSNFKTGQPSASLLKIEYSTLKAAWDSQIELEGLAPKSLVLYQIRHGGPSHDRLHNLRSLAEVKQRGRWNADLSVKRYEGHARVHQEFQRLPIPIQEKAVSCSKKLEKVLLASSGQLQTRTRRNGSLKSSRARHT